MCEIFRMRIREVAKYNTDLKFLRMCIACIALIIHYASWTRIEPKFPIFRFVPNSMRSHPRRTHPL